VPEKVDEVVAGDDIPRFVNGDEQLVQPNPVARQGDAAVRTRRRTGKPAVQRRLSGGANRVGPDCLLIRVV